MFIWFFGMDIFGINTSSPRRSRVTSGIAMRKKIYFWNFHV
jgi:hypothetical protein